MRSLLLKLDTEMSASNPTHIQSHSKSNQKPDLPWRLAPTGHERAKHHASKEAEGA
jgi:hypothetical protein